MSPDSPLSVATSFDGRFVSRFAPAPTGFLHLGHVVNAIYVWGVTRAVGGRVLLRVEDHDRQRSRYAFEQALLEDLEWLGFVPDAPAIAAFRGGRCEGRQSDRSALYEAELARLRSTSQVYACDCSRADVLGAAPGGGELRYGGRCRVRALAEKSGTGLRVRLQEGSESFVDVRHGPQRQCPAAQCGDLLIRDREGNWTYQFVATVDDLAQEVTLVIRGDDLLASTGRQIRLARLLGRSEPPRFLHHPLVMKSTTQKLSKSDGDTSVRDARARGLLPVDVIGRAAAAVGLIERVEPLSVADVVRLPALVALGRRLTASG